MQVEEDDSPVPGAEIDVGESLYAVDTHPRGHGPADTG